MIHLMLDQVRSGTRPHFAPNDANTDIFSMFTISSYLPTLDSALLSMSAVPQAKVDDEGLCRFGWATQNAGLNLGTDSMSYGFGGTGMKSHAGKFEKYGEAFAQGDIVGCQLDLDKVRTRDNTCLQKSSKIICVSSRHSVLYKLATALTISRGRPLSCNNDLAEAKTCSLNISPTVDALLYARAQKLRPTICVGRAQSAVPRAL